MDNKIDIRLNANGEIELDADFNSWQKQLITDLANIQMHQDFDQLVDELDLQKEFDRLIKESEEKKIKRSLRNGDHVEHVCGHGRFKARVISPLKSGKVRIKYDDPNLIPPKDDVPIEHLEWQTENGERVKCVNVEVACPKCDVAWVKSQGFHMEVWYDCPKCGAKKEDYTK